MKCPICGFDNLEGTAYCDDCGTKLSPDDMSSPPATQTNASGRRCAVVESHGSPKATPVCSSAIAPRAIQPVEEAKLIVTATGNESLINKDIVLLGRESVPDSIFPEIDLTPDDPEGYVSRRHAQIQRQDKQYTIIDLNSTNGTFVNNKRLAKDTPHPLTSGDEIRVGKTVLKFLLEKPSEGEKA